MKNANQSTNRPMRVVGDRFVGVIKGVSFEAWEEFKTGIDKAWDEIKLGIDDGIQTASQGLNKGWHELSFGIEKAKDSLFRSNDSHKSNRTKKSRNKVREKEELI